MEEEEEIDDSEIRKKIMEEDNWIMEEEEKRLDDVEAMSPSWNVESKSNISFVSKHNKSKLSGTDSEFKAMDEIKGPVTNVDGIHIPPVNEEWTFNVNHIAGNTEVDENGKPIPKEKDDKKFDEDGQEVNDKGYLVDNSGNVIEKRTK